MISHLDDVLRQLLVRELPIKNHEVELKFEQPKREWSAQLNRPTLNLFLYDVRENNELRQTRPAWEVTSQNGGKVTRRRRPIRIDVHYMITAWASDPRDEHRLLTRAMLVLYRTPELPQDLFPEALQDQPVPITLMAGQVDILRNPAETWSALDNEMRPSIPLVVTLALDPYQPQTSPLVSTRELRFGPSSQPWAEELEEATAADDFWTISGSMHSAGPLDNVELLLVEKGIEVPLLAGGRFVLGNLRKGDYTLRVSVEGKKPRNYKVKVPSPDYQLEI